MILLMMFSGPVLMLHGVFNRKTSINYYRFPVVEIGKPQLCKSCTLENSFYKTAIFQFLRPESVVINWCFPVENTEKQYVIIIIPDPLHREAPAIHFL